MKNLKILYALTTLSVVMAVLFFAAPQIIFPLPYGMFTFLLVMVICFWIAYRLNSTLGQTSETPQIVSRLTTLRNYFFVMGIFFFFDGIAHVGIPTLYPREILASHMHTFSHIFFFLGNAIIIRIPVSFISSQLVNPASWLMVVFGAVAVAWRVVNTDKLIYAFGPDAPPIIIADGISGLIFLVANALGLLLPGLYLIWLGLSSGDSLVRRRAVLLGLGMAVFFSIGPVIDIVKNQYTQLIIHLLLASSFFLMGASAFYKEREPGSSV